MNQRFIPARFPWFLCSLVLVWALFVSSCLWPCHNPSFSALCTFPDISAFSYDAVVGHQPNYHVDHTIFFTCVDKDLDEHGLVLDVMQAEILTRDLLTLVRISDLRSNATFAALLVELAEGLTKAGRVLQRFASKVRGLDDRFGFGRSLQFFAYASHSIVVMKNYASNIAKVSLPSHSTTLFATWSGKRNADTDKTQTFDVLLKHVERVIVHAGPIYEVLDELEGRLGRFQKLVLFEDTSITLAKTDVLAELWTKVGGNKRQLQDLDRQLALLKELKKYRGKILVSITATIKSTTTVVHQLEGMQEYLQVTLD